MAIELSDLPPWAQKQVTQKLAQNIREQAARAAQEPPKSRRKYHNTPTVKESAEGKRKLHEQKTAGVLLDGTEYVFASKRECDRYNELAIMAKTGKISELEVQKKYELIPSQTRADGKKERPITYIADFVYRKDGEVIVEDSKGYRNPSSAVYAKFVIKRKLMLWIYGISVQEV